MNLTETAGWLESVRRERDRIGQERTQLAAGTKVAVRAANEAGMPKTRIAELAGISRQTVHEMLKD